MQKKMGDKNSVGVLVLVACWKRGKGDREGGMEGQGAQGRVVEAQAGEIAGAWPAEPIARKGRHDNNND